LRPSRKAIKKVQGSRMVLDLKDKGINKDLFLYGYREPECTNIFKKELFEGMKIVDIGANIGYYVLIEAQFIGKSGKIYAIEPEPRNFKMLKKNVEINSYLSDVEFYNIAISNKTGKVLFAISPQSNHHRLSISGSKEKAIEVDSTTLDDFVEDKEMDVLRMDTEGAEWVIFKGMNRILSNNKPLKMFIEIHPKLINQYGGDVEEMLKTLAENSFILKYLVMWEPVPNSLIPYIKGRGGRERSIEYNMPLQELLIDEKTRQLLLCTSGHIYESGYKVFMERK
jgi:FkbM family methyltransferase